MLHESVLLKEAVDGLAIKPQGVYMDGTFGRGGHSRAILEQLSDQGRVIAIDKDPEAIAYGQAHFGTDPRLTLCHGSFEQIADFARELGVLGQVDGILLDLGLSSPQVDDAARGFSFMKEGPLDMRMDLSQSLTAADYVNRASAEDMIRIFRDYGEERFAKRIATAIVAARMLTPIKTTQALAEIVKQANPKWEKHKHPATRVFQAIRIHINRELEGLEIFLAKVLEVLAVGGRLVIISFHSLEDRIVKHFMRLKEQGAPLPRGLPIRAVDQIKVFKRVGKAMMPNDVELQKNKRSRSAVLRIGEKLA